MQVQFNDSGVFGADPNFLYNKATDGIGLGTTPKPWGAGQFAIDLGSSAHLRGDSATAEIGTNLYYDGTNWRYRLNGTGGLIQTTTAGSAFNVAFAPTGVAGAVATPVNKFGVDLTGNAFAAGTYRGGDATVALPTFSFSNHPDTGIYWDSGSSAMAMAVGGLFAYRFSNTFFSMGGGLGIAWGSGANPLSGDLALMRESAGTVQINSTTRDDYRDLALRSQYVNGNITFNGAGRRIYVRDTVGPLGDRTLFQSADLNHNTIFGALPNGTGATAAIQVYGKSDPNITGTPYGDLRINASFVQITSASLGPAAGGAAPPVLPVQFLVAGIPHYIGIDGSWTFGGGIAAKYYYAGAYSGPAAFQYYQTLGVTPGSTITSISAIQGQIIRILVNGGGAITLPAGVKWADGSPVWGTTYTMVSGWTDGGTYWLTTLPFST